MTNTAKTLTLDHLNKARILGITEARAGLSNTATASHILREVGAKFDLMDITPEQIKVLVSYYDRGVAIGKAN